MNVGHVFQMDFDHVGVEVNRLEDVGSRIEIVAGAVSAEGSEFLQFAGGLAALKSLPPFPAVATNGGDQLLRKGVDHGGADPMQSARMNVVAPLAEFGPGVQRGQDQ